MDKSTSVQLRQMFLSAFEEVCNRALSFDEATKNSLAQLQGKELNVQTYIDMKGFDFELSLNISFCDNGLILSAPADYSATDYDASIRVSSFTLFYNLLANQNLLNDDTILILGDIALATEFQNILSNLELDWEEPLSRVTGDIIAHELKRLSDYAKLHMRKSADILDNFVERRTRNIHKAEQAAGSASSKTSLANADVSGRRQAGSKRAGGRRITDHSPSEAVSVEILRAFSEQVTDLQKEQERVESRIEMLLNKAGSL